MDRRCLISRFGHCLGPTKEWRLHSLRSNVPGGFNRHDSIENEFSRNVAVQQAPGLKAMMRILSLSGSNAVISSGKRAFPDCMLVKQQLCYQSFEQRFLSADPDQFLDSRSRYHSTMPSPNCVSAAAGGFRQKIRGRINRCREIPRAFGKSRKIQFIGIS